MSSPTLADSVKLIEKPAFDNVQIRDFRAGVLAFRGLSGQTLRKPIEQVEWLSVDSFSELTRAEQLAANGDPAADRAYRTAESAGAQRWHKELAAVRRIQGLDRGGLYDLAVLAWLEGLRKQPGIVPRLRPHQPPPPGSARTRLAIEALNSSYTDAPSDRARREIATLLLELNIYEEVTISRPEAAPAGSGTSESPRRRGLFADVSEDGLAGATIRLDSTPLPGDSWLLLSAREALEAGNPHRSVRLIRSAWSRLPTSQLDPWILELGRALIELECFTEALEVLSARSAQSALPIAAELTYYEGLAHERAGRSDEARAAYQQVLSHPAAVGRVYESAAEAWNRLR